MTAVGSDVTLRQGNLAEIFELHKQVPELKPAAGPDDYQQRIGERPWLGLIAELAGTPSAFKLGYWQDERSFYSWIGGVVPAARRAGLAKALLLEQERLLRGLGAQLVSVKSMNRYPGMLTLLISSGYRISGLEGSDPDSLKICFSKSLQDDADSE